MTPWLDVRGSATPEEIAAVVAALVARGGATDSPALSRYEAWRAGRQAALRRANSRT